MANATRGGPVTYIQEGTDINEIYVIDKNKSIQHDGFGLITLQIKYTADSDRIDWVDTDFKRGDNPLSDDGAEYWKRFTLYKVSGSSNDGVCTITADYCGIEYNAVTTTTQVQVTSASAQEAIETHPNFTAIQVDRIGINGSKGADGKPIPLAGPAKYIYDNENDLTKNPNRAHFAYTAQAATQVVQYQFVGFLPSQKPEDPVNLKAGVRSYFRPNTIIRCLAYTSSADLAKQTLKRVGWINYGNIGAIVLPPPYNTLCQEYTADLPPKLPKGTPKDRKRNFLCTNASMEIYGGLYKVQADLMMSGVIGWDPDIYPVDTGTVL